MECVISVQPVPLKGPACTALSVFLTDCLHTLPRIGNILKHCINAFFTARKHAAPHKHLFHILMRHGKRLFRFLVGIFFGNLYIPVCRNQKGSLFIASFLRFRTPQRIDLIQFLLNLPVKFCFPYILLFIFLCLLSAVP